MAEAYLKYLYSPEGQEIAAKNYYRPRDAEVAKKYENAFPKLKLFTIDEEFGGWTKAQKSILLTAVRSIRSANADFPQDNYQARWFLATGFFICHDFALPLHLFEVQGKKMKKSGSSFLVMIVIAVVAAGIGYWKLTGEESDTLRKIVLEQCLPNQQENQNPSPCAEVKPNAGYVVLKDRHGPLQYLLMPTYRINGTESPLLTDPSTPNFFLVSLAGA